MNFNRPIVTVPSVVPSFPDSGHTFVSYPHPDLRCLHNSLLSKIDFPNKSFSSSGKTAESASSTSALSTYPSNPISITLAESSPPDGHGQAASLALLPHNLQSHRLPLCCSLSPLSPHLALCGIGTLAPIQCDTDNAISYVITFENGCLL